MGFIYTQIFLLSEVRKQKWICFVYFTVVHLHLARSSVQERNTLFVAIAATFIATAADLKPICLL